MEMITLTCGQTVRIGAFHYQSRSTYLSNGGVLLGNPEGFNRHILERAANAMAKTWRDRKSILLMPQLPIPNGDDPDSPDYKDFLRHSLLPGCLLHAWLQSGDPSADRTELVIAFLRYDVDQPIETMVREAAHDLDWARLAAVVLSDWD